MHFHLHAHRTNGSFPPLDPSTHYRYLRRGKQRIVLLFAVGLKFQLFAPKLVEPSHDPATHRAVTPPLFAAVFIVEVIEIAAGLVGVAIHPCQPGRD